MKFITLTQAHTEKDIVINAERVESFQEERGGTKIITTEGAHLVKQTPQEIKGRLGMPAEITTEEMVSITRLARAYEAYLKGERNG